MEEAGPSDLQANRQAQDTERKHLAHTNTKA